jgi:hypothetical protein
MTLSHLDDDALSAALDREATPEEQSHLATCVACQERIEALVAVARVLGVPVPPRSPAAVNSAIQEALDGAWAIGAGASPAEPVASTAEPAVGTGEVVGGSAAAIAAQASGGRSGGRRPGAGRSRSGRTDSRPSRPSRAVVVAAVVVVTLGAVGGLLGVLAGGSGRTASTTLGARRSQAGQPAAPKANSDQVKGLNPGGAPSPAAAAPSRPGGPVEHRPDLGAQGDPAAVARLVDGQLNVGGEVGQPAAHSANGLSEPAASPCVEQGAKAAGLPGQQAALVYVATVRWQGDDGVVLVYLRPAGGRVGVVMRLADCSRLADLPV